MGKPGPISMIICLAAAFFTVVVSLVFLPGVELLPAQVFPAKRGSGESLVQTLPGAQALMKFYGDTGLQVMHLVAPPVPKADAPVVDEWKAKLVKDHGDKYGAELKSNIDSGLGDQNVKSILDMLHADKNYVYSSYALLMGLALFAGAIGIQAMGRWGAEEKTIIPAKK